MFWFHALLQMVSCISQLIFIKFGFPYHAQKIRNWNLIQRRLTKAQIPSFWVLDFYGPKTKTLKVRIYLVRLAFLRFYQNFFVSKTTCTFFKKMGTLYYTYNEDPVRRLSYKVQWGARSLLFCRKGMWCTVGKTPTHLIF